MDKNRGALTGGEMRHRTSPSNNAGFEEDENRYTNDHSHCAPLKGDRIAVLIAELYLLSRWTKEHYL